MVEYIVQDGDSLSFISEKVLGDENRWPEIYSQNAEIIGSNPNVIFPGTILQIGEPEADPAGMPWGWIIGGIGVAGLLYFKGMM